MPGLPAHLFCFHSETQQIASPLRRGPFQVIKKEPGFQILTLFHVSGKIQLSKDRSAASAALRAATVATINCLKSDHDWAQFLFLKNSLRGGFLGAAGI